MTDFKDKMHPIRFRLGSTPVYPRPCWGSLQRSPDALAGFGGSLRSRGRGWAGEEEGKGREGEVEGKGGPQVTVEPGPLRALLRHWSSTAKCLSSQLKGMSNAPNKTVQVSNEHFHITHRVLVILPKQHQTSFHNVFSLQINHTSRINKD